MKRRPSQFQSDVSGAPPATPTCSSCSCCCILAGTLLVGTVSGATAGIAKSTNTTRRTTFLGLLVCVFATWIISPFVQLVLIPLQGLGQGHWFVVVPAGLGVTALTMCLPVAVVFRGHWQRVSQVMLIAVLLSLIIIVPAIGLGGDVVVLMPTGESAPVWQRVLYGVALAVGPFLMFFFMRRATTRLFRSASSEGDAEAVSLAKPEPEPWEVPPGKR